MPNYLSAIKRLVGNKLGESPSVLDFGAVGDGVSIADAAISSGSADLTSVSNPWVSSDVGKLVMVRGAGAGGLDLCATILAYVSAGVVTLSASAATTVSGAVALFGSDSKAAIQAAVDAACSAARPGTLRVPRGTYLVSNSISLPHAATIEGAGYVSYSEISGGFTPPPSRIVGVGGFPVLAAAQNPSYAVSIRELAIQGAVVSGSKGIYAAEAWDWCIDRCFLECFGGQAIHLAAGVVAHIRRNFIQNAVMIRSGHSDWIGVLDLQISDAEVADNNLNASVVTASTTGWIAACVMRWPNGFVRHNQFAQSDVGLVATPAAAYGAYMGNRADLNRRAGFVIECSSSRWIGNWAFRNSLDGDGQYDGFTISGAANVFTGNQVLQLDADTVRHRHCFNDASAVGVDDSFANTFVGNHGRLMTGELYNFTGATTKRMVLEYTPANGQQNPENPAKYLFWDTAYHRLGIGGDGPYDTLHVMGATAGTGRIRIDSPYPRLLIRDRAAENDNKCFDLLGNAGQLLGRVVNDADNSSETWLLVTRTGVTLGYVAFPGKSVFGSNVGLGTTDKVQVMGDLGLQDGGVIYLGSARTKILSGSGSPEGVVTAVGGSIYLDTAGTLWYKATGTGSTGWLEGFGGNLTGKSLTLDDAATFLRLKKSTVLKFEIDADGNISKMAALTQPFLVKSATGAIEIQDAGGTTKFKVDINGDITTARDATLSGLTASRPVRSDASKKLVSGKIDLSSLNDVTAGSMSANQVAAWNGSYLIGLNVGAGSSDVAAGNHTHSGVYADAGHNHDGSYASKNVVTAGSATLGKLTPGGSNGSMGWNSDGQITSYTAPS
jgi:hypothetical protein